MVNNTCIESHQLDNLKHIFMVSPIGSKCRFLMGTTFVCGPPPHTTNDCIAWLVRQPLGITALQSRCAPLVNIAYPANHCDVITL